CRAALVCNLSRAADVRRPDRNCPGVVPGDYVRSFGRARRGLLRCEPFGSERQAEESVMNKVTFAALAALCCCSLPAPAAADGGGPRVQIVGKWEELREPRPAVPSTVEFTRDGILRGSLGTLTVTGTYKFLDDQTIETAMPNPLNPKEVKVTRASI